jgi:hypothetical protein
MISACIGLLPPGNLTMRVEYSTTGTCVMTCR